MRQSALKVFVICAGLLGAGCGHAELDSEVEPPKFKAGVALKPEVPSRGERVYLTVEVHSEGGPTVAAVEVSVRDSSDGIVYQRVWKDMKFETGVHYDLLSSFMTANVPTDTPNIVSVRVLGDAPGEVLYDRGNLASFVATNNPRVGFPIEGG